MVLLVIQEIALNTGFIPFSKGSALQVLIAQEEYSSGEENDEEEETTTAPTTSLVAMAKTPTPSSLFDSPNEKAPIPNASCFMAKSSEVSSSKPSNDNSSNFHDDS